MDVQEHLESKEHLRIQSAHLFCCSRSLISGVQCDVENCLIQSYIGPCDVASAEIAVAVSLPTVRCEVVISFLQANEMSLYLTEEASCSVARQCMYAYCPADTSLAA